MYTDPDGKTIFFGNPVMLEGPTMTLTLPRPMLIPRIMPRVTPFTSTVKPVPGVVLPPVTVGNDGLPIPGSKVDSSTDAIPESIRRPQASDIELPFGLDKILKDANIVKSENQIDWANPPENPSDLDSDWEQDTSHKNPNGKNFKNKKTDDVIEFHKGQKGQKGFKGKNHWHRHNKNKTNNKDAYLDKNGNPCAKNSKESHIMPKK